jgi:putative pyruvate formate lyase activating enzyme
LSDVPIWPAYLGAIADGTLRCRVDEALRALEACDLCPRRCKADRLDDGRGVCCTGRRARVASWGPHHGEERCLSGQRGSGTIFFSRCNMACEFCQNADVSQASVGEEVDAAGLAAILLAIQERGCHNVNLVSPSHVVPQILEALLLAADAGLRLPLVYNSGGYDGSRSLAFLDGLVDIYLPDFKVWRHGTAGRLLGAGGYPAAARRSLREMHRQVGPLVIDEAGIARRGVLVRHLVLPGLLDESAEIFRFIAGEVSPESWVNVMGQYRPAHRAAEHPGIDRPLRAAELAEARRAAAAAGLRVLEE